MFVKECNVLLVTHTHEGVFFQFRINNAGVNPPPLTLMVAAIHFLALPGWGQYPASFEMRIFDRVLALGVKVSASVAMYGPDTWSIHRMGQHVWDTSISVLPSATKVILVGYSMGGFVADSMMHDPRAAHKLAGVVFISTACTHTKHILMDTILNQVATTISRVAQSGERDDEALDGAAKPRMKDTNTQQHAVAGFTEEDMERMVDADRVVVAKVMKHANTPSEMMGKRLTWKQQALAIFLWCALETQDAVPVLPHVPVLVIHGERDVMVPPESAWQLHAFFGEDLCTLDLLPNAGHNLFREHYHHIGNAISEWFHSAVAGPYRRHA